MIVTIAIDSWKGCLDSLEAARAIADQLELLVDRAHWPFPTYRDLLFYV